MTTTHRFPTAVHAGLEQGGTLLRLVDRSGNAYEFEMDDVALFELTRASTTLIYPLRHKPAAATPPFLVVIDPIQSRLEDRDAVPLVVRAGSREMANSICQEWIRELTLAEYDRDDPQPYAPSFEFHLRDWEQSPRVNNLDQARRAVRDWLIWYPLYSPADSTLYWVRASVATKMVEAHAARDYVAAYREVCDGDYEELDAHVTRDREDNRDEWPWEGSPDGPPWMSRLLLWANGKLLTLEESK
jgi:hypothetical protein